MSNDLAVAQDVDQLTNALQSYQPEDYNLLLPTTDLRFIAQDHRIVINTVRLDPEDDFWPVDVSWSKINGRWQKNVEGYALSKRGLRRLMHISGATITDSQTRYDEDGRVHARATVQMTMADGLTRQFIANYSWDTPARIEEAEARYQEKVERQPDKKAKHRKAFEADRHRIIKFATSLAESGAINRALRDALTTKNSYTPEDIQKPFVCLQVVEPRRPEIDLDHPVIRKLISHYMLETGKFPPIYEMQREHRLEESRARQPQLGGPDPMSDAVAAGEVEAPERQTGVRLGGSQPAITQEMEVFDDEDEEEEEPERQAESPDPRDWDDRPLEPEELRRRMNLEPGEDTPVSMKLFEKYHAAMSTLTGGNDDKRHRIQDYLYGAYSSKDMAAWQLGRLYFWVGTSKEVIDETTGLEEWVPCNAALKEAPAVIKAHEEEAGQLDMFDEEEAA